jgi:hypothetical protein
MPIYEWDLNSAPVNKDGWLRNHEIFCWLATVNYITRVLLSMSNKSVSTECVYKLPFNHHYQFHALQE